MSDHFIPKEQLSAYERWELGSLAEDTDVDDWQSEEEATERERAEAEAKAAAEEAAAALAAERERVLAEAHEDGHAAGLAEGRAQAQRELERLQQVAAHAESLLGEAAERLAGEMLELALELARQMIRTELKVRREALLPVVREALESLPHASAGAQLAVNPADAELVRAHIGDELEGGGSLRLIEDHRIEPGGCRIVTPSGEVDATLATRWKRLVAALGVEHDWLQS